MTTEEFFNMNVGDEFEISGGNKYSGKYRVYEIITKSSCKEMYVTNGCCGYIIKKYYDYFSSGFISYSQKIPTKTPIEKVQEKIDQLKLELSKLEDEKKSLEIQAGKFYEIMYSDGLYKKTEIFFIEKIEWGVEGVLYHVINKNGKIKYANKHSRISFKKIEDISVVEEAWKNV